VPVIRRNNCIYATPDICHCVDDCLVCALQTRQSSTQSDKYQVSHRYSYFFWWQAQSRPKHVEERNKHTKKNCAPSWLYLQDYTRMHGLQNIKNIYVYYKSVAWLRTVNFALNYRSYILITLHLSGLHGDGWTH